MTTTPVLETRDLSKVFNPGTHREVTALKNVSLTVRSGEVLLIKGPSGSGKTTLVSLLTGLMRPTTGTIHFRGQPLPIHSPGKLADFRRTNVGFVFQSSNLLKNLTALENVMIGNFKQPNARKSAEALLKRLEVLHRKSGKPDTLSGGEAQRVAIARALINEPPLIFADEPTASLDSKIGHEVMQLLCEIACHEGKAVVIVSHDERLMDIAKRVITIEDGQLKSESKGGHDTTCKMHRKSSNEIIHHES